MNKKHKQLQICYRTSGDICKLYTRDNWFDWNKTKIWGNVEEWKRAKVRRVIHKNIKIDYFLRIIWSLKHTLKPYITFITKHSNSYSFTTFYFLILIIYGAIFLNPIKIRSSWYIYLAWLIFVLFYSRLVWFNQYKITKYIPIFLMFEVVKFFVKKAKKNDDNSTLHIKSLYTNKVIPFRCIIIIFSVHLNYDL